MGSPYDKIDFLPPFILKRIILAPVKVIGKVHAASWEGSTAPECHRPSAVARRSGFEGTILLGHGFKAHV